MQIHLNFQHLNRKRTLVLLIYGIKREKRNEIAALNRYKHAKHRNQKAKLIRK